MTLPPVVWGSPGWIAVALGVLGVAFLALLWGYARIPASWSLRLGCATLKAIAFAALAMCLLEPLLTGTRARQGANAFAILADNSQSQQIRDADSMATRGDRIRETLDEESPWRVRLGQDFDVRRYAFDTHARAVDDFASLDFDGPGSSLDTSLGALSRRYEGLPLAGVMLFSDGNRTDGATNVDLSKLPPIYPVIARSAKRIRDISVSGVSVSRANFEAAPVVIRADVTAQGFEGDSVVAVVVDEAGKEVERQTSKVPGDGKPLAYRFQFRPKRSGLAFYSVKAFAESDASEGNETIKDPSVEPTLANNSRLVVVDQGGGPYRVLYVGGRPNWEYKFLRRAVDEDDQVRFVGLLRIARRQPKFDFQAAGSRKTSPLFEGFDNPDEDTAERFDQPVLVRIGTEDESELRDGFPKSAEELYRYHAIILDDLEAAFFTQDQLALLCDFVSVRGGGLLMLGGPESFSDGKYQRTPVADMLPVYLDRKSTAAEAGGYRLKLTREGWLQPWMRTRKTEGEERKRLDAMPLLQSINPAAGLKPGAAVLAEASDRSGKNIPALAVQQFGRGHVAAMMLGDVWRWGLHRKDQNETDFDRAWRQTVRWLVGDVPKSVEVEVKADPENANAVRVAVRVRDADFRPLDNADVSLELRLPDQTTMTLPVPASGREAGSYATTFTAKTPGAYHVKIAANGPDGNAVGNAEAGWAAQPAADEFARIAADREYLESLAAATGGEVIDPADLDTFVAALPSKKAPITEPWTSPLWHTPIFFVVAIACVVAEWGLRRTHGLT